MGGLLLLLSILGLSLIGAMMKQDRRKRDRERRTYKLYFPSSLDTESVITWIRSISGHRSASTIAFELWSSSAGFEYRLKVPWQADFIIGQLQAHLPGLRYEREEAPPRPDGGWTRAVELGLSTPGRPLAVHEGTSTSIVGSARGVEPGETVMMQWVISPAKRARPPIYKEARTDSPNLRHLVRGSEASKDEVSARRQKLEEPNFQAVMRIAAAANTATRADFLIANVKNALRSTHTHATHFRKRLLTQNQLQGRIDYPATPAIFPMQLSAIELAALIAWPVGNPLIPGLPPVMSRVLPAAESVPRAGMVIGTSTFPGHERPVAIGWEQALMHTHVLGATGTGKSVTLAHMARQAMDAGFGIILIETEGNLYQAVLDYVPSHRINDVVLMDVSDYQHPVGFNVLDQGHPMAVIDQIMDLFVHKYGNMGVWAQEYLYHGLRTLAESPGLSFTDLAALLMPRTTEEVAWVDSITRSLKDDELKRWWQRQDNRDRKEQQQRADPVLSRIWQLSARPELRYIMGQSTSTVKIADVLKENKIMLVNLKGVSKDTASLAGTLLMNATWQAVKAAPKEKPSFIFLDEFGDFMDLPIDTESMLAQARKHSVGMVLANQNMGQLTPGVRDAVLSNARNKVVLQVNSADSNMLIREFGKHLETDDFTHLQAYEAIAQVQTPTGVSSPMSIRTIAPGRRSGNAGEVIYRSRKSYSRKLAEVHSEIESRHKTAPSGPRPKIGTDGGP